jgi:hypothetical protein
MSKLNESTPVGVTGGYSIDSLNSVNIKNKNKKVPHSFMVYSETNQLQTNKKKKIKKHLSFEDLSNIPLNDLKDVMNSFGELKVTAEIETLCKKFHEIISIRKEYISDYCYPWEDVKLDINQNYENYKNVDDKGYEKTPIIKYYDDAYSYQGEMTDLEEEFEIKEGVFQVYSKEEKNKSLYSVKSMTDFFKDYTQIMNLVTDQAAKSFSFRRLSLLELKFVLYQTLHSSEEVMESKEVPHRDFYNVRKVDTHVHLASSMNQKHLLRFIKKKLKNYPGIFNFDRKKVKNKNKSKMRW